MQTFIEGIAVARKYKLPKIRETIKPNGVNITPSGCESQESCVTSQQTADSFFCPILNKLSEQVLTITDPLNCMNPGYHANKYQMNLVLRLVSVCIKFPEKV